MLSSENAVSNPIEAWTVSHASVSLAYTLMALIAYIPASRHLSVHQMPATLERAA